MELTQRSRPPSLLQMPQLPNSWGQSELKNPAMQGLGERPVRKDAQKATARVSTASPPGSSSTVMQGRGKDFQAVRAREMHCDGCMEY